VFLNPQLQRLVIAFVSSTFALPPVLRPGQPFTLATASARLSTSMTV